MPEARIWLFDTDLGLCAFLRAPNGRTLMVDCGIRTGFSPSRYVSRFELADGRLDLLVVSHPHADHLLDIENAMELRPRSLLRQPYDWDDVEASQKREYVHRLDNIPWRDSYRAYVDWQAEYEEKPEPVDWGAMDVRTFCLPVEEAKQLDGGWVNNSGIVVVVSLGSFKIVLPGDLEAAGWERLLQRADFRDAIARPTVFVTSHHGHDSGYTPLILEAMGRPAFNFNVGHRRDARMSRVYDQPEHASGITHDGETRYAFSNWRQGAMLLRVQETGEWRMSLQRLLPTAPREANVTSYGRINFAAQA